MQASFLILAQAAPAGGGGGGLLGMLVPMLLIFALFYFMMIRPQQRKEKERQKMIAELRAGQRVIFAGGLIGTIYEARPQTFLIEVASGTRIEVARGAVSRTLKEGEAPVVDPRA
jgi:preprotein translocase subunit YajC